MRLDVRTLRVFVAGLGLGLIGGVLIKADYSRLIDGYYEQRARARILDPWMRQAAPVTYAECREAAFRCMNKVVVWAVSHPAKGVTSCDGLGSQPIFWRNEPQVPIVSDSRHPFPVIGLVTGIGAQGVELLFIGSPDAAIESVTFAENR